MFLQLYKNRLSDFHNSGIESVRIETILLIQTILYSIVVNDENGTVLAT